METRLRAREDGDLEANRQRAIRTNNKIGAAIGVIDFLDLVVIFAFFIKEYWHELLEKTGRFILFPIAAVATSLQAFLAWRLVSLEERPKAGSVIKAIVETLVALAVAVAVGGGLAGLLAIAAPIIFALTFGSKTLFQAGSAIYNFGKAKAAANPEDEARFKMRGINFSVGTLVGSLAVTSIILVMLLGMHEFAALGMTAAGIGATFCAYHLLSGRGNAQVAEVNRTDKEPLLNPDEEMESVNTHDHKLEHDIKKENAATRTATATPPPATQQAQAKGSPSSVASRADAREARAALSLFQSPPADAPVAKQLTDAKRKQSAPGRMGGI